MTDEASTSTSSVQGQDKLTGILLELIKKSCRHYWEDGDRCGHAESQFNPNKDHLIEPYSCNPYGCGYTQERLKGIQNYIDANYISIQQAEEGIKKAAEGVVLAGKPCLCAKDWGLWNEKAEQIIREAILGEKNS